MGVLSFDGSDDRLKWTTLATSLSNVSDGAWTLAVLLKRGTPLSGDFDGISYLLSGTGNGVVEAGISFNSSHNLTGDIDAGSVTATTFTSLASPYLFVSSKASGSVALRTAWKLGSGGSWTHVDHSGALADQTAATQLVIAAWQGTSDPFYGWIGVVAYWEGAMSDANKEALDNNWRTSDWYTSSHGTPQFLAELNVAGSSVVDLIGNATDLTATGTTLDSGETLDSWNFDGTGAPPPRRWLFGAHH